MLRSLAVSKVPTDKQLVDQLGQVPLFASVSSRKRKVLARSGKILTWKEGSTPIVEGEAGVAFFLVLDGSVEVTRGGTRLAVLGNGDFVGEMALLNQAPRNASVTALTTTTVYALTRPGLKAAISSDPTIGMSLLEAMAERVGTTA